jgi:ribosomal protein L12E/L44/L45/RPP1/RPP2
MQKTTLSHCPSEILGIIVEYAGAVSGAHIWCGGDKVVNSKLRSKAGLKKWQYIDRSREYLPWLPSFVSELQGLEEVALEISKSGLVPRLELGWLETLPCQIKKLSLRCESAEKAWLDAGERQLWVTRKFGRDICMRTNLTFHFPALVELSLEYELDKDDVKAWKRYSPNFVLAAFPRSLRVLNLPDATNWGEKGWDALPNGIEFLNLGVETVNSSWQVSRFEHLHTLLLPSLKQDFPEPFFSQLSPSLTRLEIGEGAAELTSASALPKQLQVLHTPVLSASQFISWAKAKPRVTEPSEKLDESQKDEKTEKDKKEDDPRSKLCLTTLGPVELTEESVLYLPNTLMSLIVSSNSIGDTSTILASLPPNLQSLTWYPPSDDWSLNEWHSLPVSLTFLHIETFSTHHSIEDQIKLLPPLLTHLSVSSSIDGLDDGIVHTELDHWMYELPPSVKRVVFNETVELRYSPSYLPKLQWVGVYDALRNRNTELLQILIREGVVKEQATTDPDDPFELLNVAVTANAVDCLKMLVETGEFRARRPNEYFEPFFKAAEFGSVSCLDYLYRISRQPSALAIRNAVGLSLAHVAAAHGQIAVLGWLKAHGFEFPSVGPTGETNCLPIAIALENRHWSTAAWLSKEAQSPAPPIEMIVEAAKSEKVYSLADPFPAFTTLLEAGIPIPNMLCKKPLLLFKQILNFRDPVGMLTWLKMAGPSYHPFSLQSLFGPRNAHGQSLAQFFSSMTHLSYLELFHKAKMDRYTAVLDWLAAEDPDQIFVGQGSKDSSGRFVEKHTGTCRSPLEQFALNGHTQAFRVCQSHGVELNEELLALATHHALTADVIRRLIAKKTVDFTELAVHEELVLEALAIAMADDEDLEDDNQDQEGGDDEYNEDEEEEEEEEDDEDDVDDEDDEALY